MMGGDILAIASKAHAYRPYLLTTHQWESLLGANSLKDLVNLLYLTYYRERLVSLEIIDRDSIYDVIRDIFADRLNMFSRLPDDYYPFMRVYIARWEINGIIKIISEKIKGIPHRDPDKYSITKMGIIDFEALIRSRTIDGIFQYLPVSIFGDSIQHAYNFWRRYHQPYVIELALKNGLFKTLIRHLRNLPDEDQDLAKYIIGVEIDNCNINVALGPILYRYSPEILEYFLVPYSYKISTSTLKSLYGSDPTTLTRVTPPIYRDLVSYYLNKNDHLAKAELNRILLRNAQKLTLLDSIGFGFVLAMIKFFEIEFENLSILIDGLSLGLPPKTLRQLIVF